MNPLDIVSLISALISIGRLISDIIKKITLSARFCAVPRTGFEPARNGDITHKLPFFLF